MLSNTIMAIASILDGLLSVYFWIIIIATLLSWVRPDPYNPIVRTLYVLTEPVFYRIRKWLPFTYTAGMDFSPIVLIVALELVQRIVIKSMYEYGALLRM